MHLEGCLLRSLYWKVTKVFVSLPFMISSQSLRLLPPVTIVVGQCQLRISFYVMCAKSLSLGPLTWKNINTLILWSCCWRVMNARNLSSSMVPWRCIYALILVGSHLHVMYVRNLSKSLLPWSCIYVLILGIGHLYVKYVRNSASSLVSWSCISHALEWPLTCHVCKKCFKLHGDLKVHQCTHTGDHPFMCDVCKKSFKLRWDLEVTHIHSSWGGAIYMWCM
jgi:hypothetical protein